MLISSDLFCADNSFNLKVGDKIKLIENSKKDMIIYYFMNSSSCAACDNNIRMIMGALEGYKVEHLVILDGVDQANIDNFFTNTNNLLKYYPDPTGLVTEYYKMNLAPSMLVLKPNGEIADFSELKAKGLTIPQIIRYARDMAEEVKQNTYKGRFVVEKRRIPVIKDTVSILSNYHRDFIYLPNTNSFAFRHRTKTDLYFVDSLGKITIPDSLNKKMDGYFGDYGITYDQDNNIILLINSIYPSTKNLYSYNVQNDEVKIESQINITDLKNDLNFSIRSLIDYPDNTIYFSRSFERFKKNFANLSYDASVYSILFNGTIKDTLNIFAKTIKEYNQISKLQNHFLKIRDHILVFQLNTNELFVINKSLELVNTYKINLGNNYKILPFKITCNEDKLGPKEYHESFPKLNKIMLFNKEKGHILIPYTYTKYPEGIDNFFDKNVKHLSYFMILNEKGESILSDNEVLPPSSIPFYYEGNKLFCSELNEYEQLEIVEYEIYIK